jgi:uncharacterized protein (DUF1697 family)
MSKYDIKWRVEEQVSGPGKHDGGVRDGDRSVLASGQVVKEGDEANLRAQLTAALKDAYPEHTHGPTYDLDRIYTIEMQPVR